MGSCSGTVSASNINRILAILEHTLSYAKTYVKRQHHKWFSHRLGREMELLVFGHAGAKVLVFPTREGRFYEYENWGLVDALRPSIDGGYIRLFCVDGVDSESLYCRSAPPPDRARRHRQYESYIRREVIPFMLSENGIPSLIVHGCSIGANIP